MNNNMILPQVKNNTGLKPYWAGTELTLLNNKEKQARREWIEAGEPTDPASEIYQPYKESGATEMRISV